MSTLHQEAQNRVNTVFESLKQEAISLLHNTLFSQRKIVNYESHDFGEKKNQNARNDLKEDNKEQNVNKSISENKVYEAISKYKIKKENEEDEEIREIKEKKGNKELKDIKKDQEYEESKGDSLYNPLPLKRPRDGVGQDIYPPFLDEYKPEIAERKEMICKLYSSFVSPRLIGRLFSMSVNSVHILGDWKQVPVKIAQKNRETRQRLQKLISEGHPFHKVIKHSGLNSTTASIMLDEYPIFIVLKSPEEKKKFIETAINYSISKKKLANITRIQPLKIYTWANHLNNDEDFSDDEFIEDKSGEYSRETIRKTLYDFYLNKSIEGAAERNGVSNIVKVEEWIRIVKDFKKNKREENAFD